MASLKQLPPSLVDSIDLPIKILQFIGLNFFDSKISIRNLFKLILFLAIFFSFLICQISYIAVVDEIGAGFLEIANAIPCLVLLLHSFSKLTLIRKKHLVRKIILDIAELWPNEIHVEEKKNLMNEWLGRLKTFRDSIQYVFFLRHIVHTPKHRNYLIAAVFKFTVIGLILYMVPQILIYFFVISRGDDGASYYNYPFLLHYPFKLDSMWKYLLLYLKQVVFGFIIHIGIYHSCDLLLFTLTVDVCVLLRLLSYDLVNLEVKPGREEESLVNLKRIVETHQKLLRLAQNLNQLFGMIMFTVMISSSVVICLFGFLAIVAKGGQSFIYMSTVLQVMFIIFFISLPGQILYDTSSGVADAAYQTLWYNSDLRFRKIIFIIIARSQTPCRLQASKYTDMNFTAYCKICSTAWSYLSLVNQMYQKIDVDI